MLNIAKNKKQHHIEIAVWVKDTWQINLAVPGLRELRQCDRVQYDAERCDEQEREGARPGDGLFGHHEDKVEHHDGQNQA